MTTRLVTAIGIMLGASMTRAHAESPPIFSKGETILFQGDSITDGNRGRNADPNHILGHGYAFIIASRYGAAFPGLDLKFVNRGISGNAVADLVRRWDADTLAIKPNVLSVLVGINDIYFAMAKDEPFSAAQFEPRLDQLLARTKAALPKLKIILGEPFILPVGMTLKNPERWGQAVREAGSAVARLGEKYHVPVVHFQRAFDEAAKRAPADHWIWDGIHPTYAGHELMANEWIRNFQAFYGDPLQDPAKNSAIAPVVNMERDSYNWLHRHRDVIETQQKGNPDVVLIGDSITHFWGGEPKAARTNGPKSWDETFAGLRVVNMGFGWDRTQNLLWRLENGEFEGLEPKTVILNIGTNNLVGDSTARTNTPEEVVVGIERIVDLIRNRAPNTRIFVMGVFPRGFVNGNELDLRIRRLNGLLGAKFGGVRKVVFLDIGPQLREPDGSVSKVRFSDGTHPTEAGYTIWGKALKEAGAIPGAG